MTQSLAHLSTNNWMTPCIPMSLISTTWSSLTGARSVHSKTKDKVNGNRTPIEKLVSSTIGISLAKPVNKLILVCETHPITISITNMHKLYTKTSHWIEGPLGIYIVVVDPLTKGHQLTHNLKSNLSIHLPLKQDPKFICITLMHKISHIRRLPSR